MTYVILLWTSVSLLTLAAGAFPSFTARNQSAVGLAVPDLYAGRAATREDRCTPNQALPYHRIKGLPSVQRVPGLQAIWNSLSLQAAFIASSSYVFSLYLLKRHFLHFCCRDICFATPFCKHHRIFVASRHSVCNLFQSFHMSAWHSILHNIKIEITNVFNPAVFDIQQI